MAMSLPIISDILLTLSPLRDHSFVAKLKDYKKASKYTS